MTKWNSFLESCSIDLRLRFLTCYHLGNPGQMAFGAIFANKADDNRQLKVTKFLQVSTHTNNTVPATIIILLRPQGQAKRSLKKVEEIIIIIISCSTCVTTKKATWFKLKCKIQNFQNPKRSVLRRAKLKKYGRSVRLNYLEYFGGFFVQGKGIQFSTFFFEIFKLRANNLLTPIRGLIKKVTTAPIATIPPNT